MVPKIIIAISDDHMIRTEYFRTVITVRWTVLFTLVSCTFGFKITNWYAHMAFRSLALHLTKRSGLCFWKFPVLNGKTYSTIFHGKEDNFGIYIPKFSISYRIYLFNLIFILEFLVKLFLFRNLTIFGQLSDYREGVSGSSPDQTNTLVFSDKDDKS